MQSKMRSLSQWNVINVFKSVCVAFFVAELYRVSYEKWQTAEQKSFFILERGEYWKDNRQVILSEAKVSASKLIDIKFDR